MHFCIASPYPGRLLSILVYAMLVVLTFPRLLGRSLAASVSRPSVLRPSGERALFARALLARACASGCAPAVRIGVGGGGRASTSGLLQKGHLITCSTTTSSKKSKSTNLIYLNTVHNLKFPCIV